MERLSCDNVPNDQKAQVINVNETALSLDGNKTKHIGKWIITFIDGGLSAIAIASPKSLQSTTLITGSNALGKAMSPHFQFSLHAKSDDQEKISTFKYSNI